MTDGLQDQEPVPHDEAFHSLMEIFDELSFKEKWKKVFHGIKQPKDTGEYKYAKLQLQRLSAPAAAVLIPLLAVLILTTLSFIQPPRRQVEVTLMEPEAVEELEELEDILEDIEPPEPIEMEIPDEMSISEVTEDVPAPPTEFSPQPATLDSVALTKSPVILKGILGSRSPGARGSALAGYGGSGQTERSVMLALRWLKKYQEADGSWNINSGGGSGASGPAKPAMTGLALLTYLAHGETPASEEFGPTVERAIKWMLANQTASGHFNGSDTHDYCQPIATYALCEAFALTKIPMLKDAAELSATRIVKGQNPLQHLWNYNFNPSQGLQNPGERNDLSYAGWCMQALKAADVAGLEVEGLRESMKRAVEGMKLNFRQRDNNVGGFAYTTGDSSGPLTSVGALCMQLLGAGKFKETRMAVRWLNESASCDWEKPWGPNPIYYWYYTTQVMFHDGGGTWNDWNRQFSPALVQNQIVIKDAIRNLKGDLVDIGYWKPANEAEYGKGYVYNTTLCALMLQVYYRYLPTYRAPAEIAEEDLTIADDSADIDIEIL